MDFASGREQIKRKQIDCVSWGLIWLRFRLLAPLPACTPANLCSLIVRPCLRVQSPTPVLMSRYLSATAALLSPPTPSSRSFSASGLALMVGGLAALHVRPPRVWLARFIHVLLAALPDCRGAQLAKAMSSLAQLGPAPIGGGPVSPRAPVGGAHVTLLLEGAVSAAATCLAAGDLDVGSAAELRWGMAVMDDSTGQQHLKALDRVLASRSTGSVQGGVTRERKHLQGAVADEVPEAAGALSVGSGGRAGGVRRVRRTLVVGQRQAVLERWRKAQGSQEEAE